MSLVDRLRPALAFALLLALASSGRAAVTELIDCERVPEAVRFVRETGNGTDAPAVARYELYPSEGWIRRDYKNPERALFNGPLFGRNCSPQSVMPGSVAAASTVQQLSFRFRTRNYFSSGIADHLAILLRASLDRIEGASGGSQVGRGLAIFASAAHAENFGLQLLGAGVSIGLRDETWYSVNIVATRSGIAALISDSTGASLQWTWADPSPADGTGYGFAVLCAYSPNASCEFTHDSAFASVPFEVQISDIAMRWLSEGSEGLSSFHEKRVPRRFRAS